MFIWGYAELEDARNGGNGVGVKDQRFVCGRVLIAALIIEAIFVFGVRPNKIVPVGKTVSKHAS
jgi:hypothetical protein